jgi:hypothetical protein
MLLRLTSPSAQSKPEERGTNDEGASDEVRADLVGQVTYTLKAKNLNRS